MMLAESKGLLVSFEDHERMRQDVRLRAPEEACGVIAGQDGVASKVFAVTNAEHSYTGFRMDPREQIAIFLELDAQGLEMLAIYHSHPDGPEMPSETDLAEFAYPGVMMLIWFPKGDDWDCRLFAIVDGEVNQTSYRVY